MKEIREAVFQMRGSKAPRPDGFHGVFFHSLWETIVEDIRGFVLNFTSEMGSTRSLNATHIVLIPKRLSTEYVG